MPTFRRYALVAFAAVMSCCLFAEGADVLEKSKSIRIDLASGKTVSGRLVEQPTSTIRIRIRLNERATFKASEITSITSEDKTYKYDSDTNRWEAVAAVAKKEKDKPKEKGKTAASVPATQTMTGEGVGETPEEARKDAIRDAVRKVTGALVIGTTTVENDKVIKDKVLTYSDGVIVANSYKELERKKEGDIWRMKISATVINRKLAEKLEDAGFEVRKIYGEGMAAEVLSRVEARKRATEMLQAALEDIPKVVVAQAAKPTARDYDEDTGELKLTVQVAADPKRYEEASRRLVAVLEKVRVNERRFTFAAKAGNATTSKGKGPGTSSVRNTTSKGKGPGTSSVRNKTKGDTTLKIIPVEIQKADDFFGFTLPEEKKGWYMWVMTSCSQDYSAVAWNVYQLDCVHKDAIKHLAGKPTLVVTLLDKEKGVLATKEIDLSSTTDIPGWMFHHTTTREKTVGGRTMRATHNVGIAPLYLMGKSFSPIQGVKVPIKISETGLRKLDNVRCEVEFR